MFGIHDKVFNQNQFWEGGSTTQLRLDELNALQTRQVTGEGNFIGDTSAFELVERIFQRTGSLGNRLVPELCEVFAEALVKLINDKYEGDPLYWLNPESRHAARDIRRFGYLTEEARTPGMVSGYAKPTEAEAKRDIDETKAVQESPEHETTPDALNNPEPAPVKDEPSNPTTSDRLKDLL